MKTLPASDDRRTVRPRLLPRRVAGIFARVACAGALTVGLMPLPAFATGEAAGDGTADLSKSGIVEQFRSIATEGAARYIATGDPSQLAGASDDAAAGARAANAALSDDGLPESFDLRDRGVVTPVKLQNPWGTCWGFASIAASETSILSELGTTYDQMPLDLSERHLAWFALTPRPENEFDPQAGEGLIATDNEGDNRMNTGGMPLMATMLFSSGIGPALAKAIVAYREANGIHSRAELKKVPKLGPRAFEQCAGFLRVRDSRNPLDATAVHPESYAAAKALLKALGYAPDDVSAQGLADISQRVEKHGVSALAAQVGVGEPTLRDIIGELQKPGRDPRDDLPKPVLRTDVLDMRDLLPGMALKGTVRNVVDFGAFVDIGVHQDGLVHISRMSDRFIRHPSEVVRVGDVVDVWVSEVDLQRQRIALTMLPPKA